MNKPDAKPGGPGAKLRAHWRNFFWVKDIFALEFGTSDVQANYSRVYAWMANQLGHMTLGLAVALLFVWIKETSLSAIIKLSAWRGDETAVPLSCQWGWLCAPSNLMLTLTFVIVLGGLVLFLLWWAWTGRCHQPAPLGGANAFPRIPKGVAVAIHAGVALLLGGVVIAALWIRPADMAVADWAALAGTLIATLVIAAGVVVLCKDAEVLMLSLFGLAIVLVLGTGVLDVPVRESAARWEFVVIAGLVLGLIALTYLFRYNDAEYRYLRESGANWWREVWGLIFVIFFLGVLHFGLDDAWREALAAAFASVTLWWVKEFGSDIPGVHEEIGRAAARRPPPYAGAERDFDQVELDYLTDARMDARTDGLFYIAGAWIGAGVISDLPVLTNRSWETGAELVGCLIFILIFMIEGRRWSFRQVALDRMGARRASRLAVFRSAVRMVVIEPDTPLHLGSPSPEHFGFVPCPVDLLDKFARGGAAGEGAPFDHVLVFGAPGSGRTPLGLALASEASLASHPTANDGRIPPPEMRTGRYVRLNQLESLLSDVKRRHQLQAYPLTPVWFHRNTGLVRPEGSTDEVDHECEAAASLVIVDDVAFIGGATAQDACAALNLAGRAQQTVWMFSTGQSLEGAIMHESDTETEWRPDYRAYENEIIPLRDALNKAAGEPQRIAVAFVRRYEGKAS